MNTYFARNAFSTASAALAAVALFLLP